MKQFKLTDLTTNKPIYLDLFQTNELYPTDNTAGTPPVKVWMLHAGTDSYFIAEPDANRIIQMREALSVPVPSNQPPVHYPPAAAK